MKKVIALAGAAAVVLAVAALPSAAGPTAVGPAKCKMCHTVEFDSWAATKHATTEPMSEARKGTQARKTATHTSGRVSAAGARRQNPRLTLRFALAELPVQVGPEFGQDVVEDVEADVGGSPPEGAGRAVAAGRQPGLGQEGGAIGRSEPRQGRKRRAVIAPRHKRRFLTPRS